MLDRLGRARVGERARDPASSEVTNVDNVGFLPFFTEEFGIEGCLRLYIPGFYTRLAQNIGRQRHWEVLCVLHKLEMVG